VHDGQSNTAFYSERLVGDGNSGRYTPWRDIAVYGDLHFYYPDDALQACAALTTVRMHYSYSGHTWLIGTYSQTGYNHILPPNAAIPDCVDHWVGTLGQGAYTARSLHPGGVNVAFGDGAVKFVSETIDLKVWRAAGSCAGSETETIP
jgi:prepilin-type processing-associated H-X9-DG protein